MTAERMPGTVVNVDGDGGRFSAVIASKEFEGKGLVEQQQLVHCALDDNMREQIHALPIKTFPPPKSGKRY